MRNGRREAMPGETNIMPEARPLPRTGASASVGLITFGALLVALVSLIGCRRRDASPDELVVLDEAVIQRIDPRFTTGSWDQKVSRLVAPGLISVDNIDARPIMMLAETILAEDDRTYLATLRADVRFPDGKAVDAQDVKYTFDSVRDPLLASPYRRTWDEILTSVEVLGPRQVRFHLVKARAPFLTDLDFGIVDRRVAAPQDDQVREAARRHDRPPPLDAAHEVVGAGAFCIGVRTSDRVELWRNPFARVPAKLARVVVRTIRDDNARFLALVGRSGDLIQNGIPPLVVETFEKDSRLEVRYSPSASLTYIGFNLNAPNTKDLRVRQAIAHAINRQAIVDSKLRGHAVLATGMLDPRNPYYANPGVTWDYDPAQARRLLDEAGFPDPDGDGPEPRMRLSWRTSNQRFRVALAQVMASQLAEVGIAVDVRPFDFATFLDDVRKGNFELFSLQATDVVEPDMLRAFFHTLRIPTEATHFAGLNRFRYHDPEVDGWLDEGAAVRDPAARRPIYARVQGRLAERLPMFPLWHEDNVAAMRRDVAGYVVTPTAGLGAAATAYRRK
jgi:peptide/nickel transport system substrate-binding protein